MNLGIYIHVPFCRSKCAYCNFYSLTKFDDELLDSYTDKVCGDLAGWRSYVSSPADTLYFGGGTPSILGAGRIGQIISTAKANFGLDNAEITIEVNPGGQLDEFFRKAADHGVNRVSIGIQSADSHELCSLGRTHTPEDAELAIIAAYNSEITNISADIMLGIPRQTVDSLARSVKFCANLPLTHVSAYMLKVEPGTKFAEQGIITPCDDQMAELYYVACDELDSAGFKQYEISNFAKPGYECRHNMKYWQLTPYIGIGPAAHSFVHGRRMQYGPNLYEYLSANKFTPPLSYDSGGSFEEYIMLTSRLTDGINLDSIQTMFGTSIVNDIIKRAEPLHQAGFVNITAESISLTRQGFLVSNSVIAALLD